MSDRASRAALVIGINDYSTLDPSGSTDLQGARNDAIAWAVAARSLGIEQIRLLASPPLSAADLPIKADGIIFGEATAEEIQQGVTWLAQALGDADVGQGMVAYSGHGSTEENRLILCPADLRADFSNAISYADIASQLNQHAPRTNITYFLDTCHAGRPRRLAEFIRAYGRRSLANGPTTAARVLRARDMVVAACQATEISQESFLRSRYNGAFTWAATAALSRAGLRTDPDSGFSFFGMTYQQLLNRTWGLLRSLGYTQRPTIEGPRSLLSLPVLHPRTLQPIIISQDEEDGGKQIFPEEQEGGEVLGFALYRIEDFSGIEQGHLLVVDDQNVQYAGQTWEAHTEYWMWGPDGKGPWPRASFRMCIIETSNPSPAITTQTTYKFVNAPFNGNVTNFESPLSGYDFWSLGFAAGGPRIGWLRSASLESQPSTWLQYTDVSWTTTEPNPPPPRPWFTIAQPGDPYGYQNNWLYFTFTSPLSPPQHPGDQPLGNNSFLFKSVMFISSGHK